MSTDIRKATEIALVQDNGTCKKLHLSLIYIPYTLKRIGF